LSSSSAYSEAKAADGLRELRAMLPAAVLLWAGRAAAARIRKPMAGMQLIASLGQMIDLVKQWRAGHGSYRPPAGRLHRAGNRLARSGYTRAA
jgi:hypothetical protein